MVLPGETLHRRARAGGVVDDGEQRDPAPGARLVRLKVPRAVGGGGVDKGGVGVVGPGDRGGEGGVGEVQRHAGRVDDGELVRRGRHRRVRAGGVVVDGEERDPRVDGRVKGLKVPGAGAGGRVVGPLDGRGGRELGEGELGAGEGDGGKLVPCCWRRERGKACKHEEGEAHVCRGFDVQNIYFCSAQSWRCGRILCDFDWRRRVCCLRGKDEAGETYVCGGFDMQTCTVVVSGCKCVVSE